MTSLGWKGETLMNEYKTITIHPSGKIVKIKPGQSIMDGLKKDFPIRADCGGRGICGKCKVILKKPDQSPPTELETHLISENQIHAGLRLACQVHVKESMEIRLPENSMDGGNIKGKVIPSGPYRVNAGGMGSGGLGLAVDIGTTTVAAYLCDLETGVVLGSASLINPQCRFGHDVVSRIQAASNPDGLDQLRAIVISAIAQLADECISSNRALYEKNGKPDIFSCSVAGRPKRPVGSGRGGLDEIPGKSGEFFMLCCGRNEIRMRSVREGYKEEKWKCKDKTRHDARDIKTVVVTGNTAMQHIFAGIDPGPIVRSPYEPESHEAMERSAASLGLNFANGCRVYVMPVISGYAGGDILSCALADGILERKETTLIIDVGTNGELILGNREGLWAASCATGPAFEGAGIACGMRAIKGAVSGCTYNTVQDRFILETIGDNAVPLGICGSGIIEAVHALREAGMLEASGRLICRENNRADHLKKRVSLLNGSAGAAMVPQVDVYVSQQDIRQIQLAKAALATGVGILLEKAQIKGVDRTVLTGAFGSGFNLQKAVEIGMLPDLCVLGTIETRGNLAGQGAVMVLLDDDKRKAAEKIQTNTTYVHLADEVSFTQRFVSQTIFPC